MELAALGMGIGALVYFSQKAMSAPVPVAQRDPANYVMPINIQTWRNSASPASSPTPQLSTAEQTSPDYMTGMTPIQKANALAAQATDQTYANNRAIAKHMMNGGDPIVLNQTDANSTVLASQYEQNAYMYQMRRNIASRGAAAQLVTGIPGNQNVDQTRPAF